MKWKICAASGKSEAYMTARANDNQQPVALTPLYFWRGARPDLLDLSSDQTGWAVALVLSREGDCCLLPIAWLNETPEQDYEDYLRFIPTAAANLIQADALDRKALQLTLADLERDGWQVNGRLDIHFTGSAVAPDFWPTTLAYLWN
jgi:hypothetical protein